MLGVLLLGVSILFLVMGLSIVPERVQVQFVNKDYLTEFKAYVRRNNRKSDYLYNIEMNNKHVWGDNVSVDLLFYELLHNEYKRSFIEFHFDSLCYAMTHQPFFVEVLANMLGEGAIKCPLAKGYHVYPNLSFTSDDYSYVWPFERSKLSGSITTNHRQTVILNGSLYLRFKQKPKRAPKRRNL